MVTSGSPANQWQWIIILTSNDLRKRLWKNVWRIKLHTSLVFNFEWTKCGSGSKESLDFSIKSPTILGTMFIVAYIQDNALGSVQGCGSLGQAVDLLIMNVEAQLVRHLTEEEIATIAITNEYVGGDGKWRWSIGLVE